MKMLPVLLKEKKLKGTYTAGAKATLGGRNKRILIQLQKIDGVVHNGCKCNFRRLYDLAKERDDFRNYGDKSG